MPEISVIVPVYNVEPYIHRCVNSILNQTFSDFELILVDDGSPDDCGRICDEYAGKDSRIHVIHQQNGGLSAARNAGIDWVFANSDSQWLAFIDSDDWVHQDYLQILLSSAKRFNVKIAACDEIWTESFCEDADIQEYDVSCEDVEDAYMDHYTMFMSACVKIYSRDAFEHLRFPVGKLHEDCFTTHIPMFQEEKVVICKVPLYYYYLNPGSIMRAKWFPKRYDELESHELRAAWLKEHGYKRAFLREMEVYVMTIYEQTEVLAKLCAEDKTYLPHFKNLRKKLLDELKNAKALGLYGFDREYLWMYLMAYPALPVWRFGQWLRGLRNNVK